MDNLSSLRWKIDILDFVELRSSKFLFDLFMVNLLERKYLSILVYNLFFFTFHQTKPIEQRNAWLEGSASPMEWKSIANFCIIVVPFFVFFLFLDSMRIVTYWCDQAKPSRDG